MSKPKIAATAAMLLLACAAARADQVTLKNGDRLTGTIKKSDGKVLVLTTDYAGDVTLQMASVKSVTSAEPLHVQLAGGRTLTGTVSTEDDSVVVAGASGPPQTSPISSVTAIRDDAEQAAYEKTIHPGFTDDWAVGANVGYALTRGNSQTSNLALAFTGVRQTLNDEIISYANAVYSTNDAGPNPSTTANTVTGGIRYDHNLTKRMFGFVAADFMSNGLQELNLRAAPTAGLGYHAIATPNTTLDLLLGAGYTHESYTTITNNFADIMAGEEFTHKIGKLTTLTENAYFYPNLNQTGQYRGDANFGSVTKLNNWLGWQLSFTDIYVSNPPAGTKQNDIVLTTGLNVSFSTK